MTIRLLPEAVVNRIAAGEVIERPAAAVKELVENALDAGASRIDITVRDGGRSLIAVTDNGHGMEPAELELAVKRHATSKLPNDDLNRIDSLGFRGEALPSIGSVARLAITSRPPGAETAWRLMIEGGVKHTPEPAAHPPGTRVEVRDLFFATPARLKFLKTAATENGHITETVKRLALTAPEVAFQVSDGVRSLLRLPAETTDAGDALFQRVARIMGPAFADNAVPVSAERGNARLFGYAGLPTLNQRQARMQFMIVNYRPVRDKVLYGSIRAAYQGVLASDRHPMVVVFLELPSEDLDVNVHPMKSEVRFRDTGLVRSLMVGALRGAIETAGHRVSTTASDSILSRAEVGRDQAGPARSPTAFQPSFARQWAPRGLTSEGLRHHITPPDMAAPVPQQPNPDGTEEHVTDYPLGAACTQVHGTFIISQTPRGIVIVDQHAAHERIVHERLKTAMGSGRVPRQGLLIPEVVELDETLVHHLVSRTEALETLGLVLEPFGPGAVVVREVPAPIGQTDIQRLVRDLADDLAHLENGLALEECLSATCASMACHGSVRAGRKLSVPEMNALLRDMETTPNTGQCSHGRPTHVELGLGDIERLFGRR
ncbi:MAG: DNA mismatch repair endonuclease MutL [Hyphomicrobiales bacterium]|nr:DNA mismatch repair endonuclease MutL [Hyphomicrobiales bacterium]